MADHVVDTNVLLVASAAHPHSPFDDSDLPRELQERVFEWLAAFRANGSRQMVWDDCFKIYEEYRNKLSDQDYGMQVVKQKMTSARFVSVRYDQDGHGVVPAAFADFDPSDRKLLAALLVDVENTSLVNATDTDWLEIERQLADAGATVEHLLEEWLRAKYREKMGS
ncbi:MAG: hypothetical protein CL908_19395 [Deltaproteobacteria bacterium]|nr:hypothetical protein [Deltaproteobacteria bacterium]